MQSGEGHVIEVEEYRNRSGLSFMCLGRYGNRGFFACKVGGCLLVCSRSRDSSVDLTQSLSEA